MGGPYSVRPGASVPPPSARLDPRDAPRPIVLAGIGGSPGIAIGPAIFVGGARPGLARRTIEASEIEIETTRFRDAVLRAQEGIRKVEERLRPAAVAGETSILEAYIAMLGDEMIAQMVERHVRDDRQNVEWAVSTAVEELSARLAGSSDPYLVERRHDVVFVGERLLRALAGEPDGPNLPHLDEPSIVVASDLSPADTAAMVREPVLALVTEVGTRTSHTSIMARALEVPAVVGVADVVASVRPHETLIVDGFRGEIVVGPTPEMIADAEARAARHIAFVRHLRDDREKQTTTADGTVVHLFGNVELPAEALLAVDHGAEGIGLYRTEFLYIDRTAPPNEDEQARVYRAIVEACAPRQVTLRTFDVGGDKFVSTIQLPAEMNPALGLRAVRLALSRPEVFKEQLRAMLRAAAHGNARIMVPMVTSLSELDDVRRLVKEAEEELDERGEPRGEDVPLGVMIEVPSAAIMADAFARDSAFLSLGTNDLVQYALAVDRTNRSLAHLASSYDPSILRLVANVVSAARAHGKPLCVCGAMASDPASAALLVGLGIRELSMEAAAIPEVKEALRRVSLAEVEALAERALAQTTAAAVASVVREGLRERFGDLAERV